MRTYLRQYNTYIIKIGLFIKHYIIINIFFISLAYPLSNTSEENQAIIKVAETKSESYIMQKAFAAELLVKNFKYKEAAKIHYDICIESDDSEVAKRATQLAGYANDYELMLKSSKRWLEISKDEIAVRHVRISIFLTLNKINEATKETLLAIKISKDKDKFALVYDTIKVFDDQSVKKVFDSVYKKYKNEYLANFYYVQILLDNNEYEKTISIIESIDKFKDFSKKESRWGIFLANAYYEIGKKDLAVKTLKEYLQFSPKNLNLNQYYVTILTLQEKYTEAIKHYRFMSANKLISFSDVGTSKKMALLNIEAKKFIDAKTFIDSLKEKDINSYYYMSGLLNIKNNKNTIAENFFNKVSVDNQNYIDSVKEIANIKAKEKDFLSLKKFFKYQNKKINNNTSMLIRLIIIETEIFFNAEKFAHAMKIINSGLEKYKNNGAFLYTRALVAEKVNRMDIVENDLKKLIQLEPENAQALNALGYTWANNDIKLKEANSYIDKALAMEPNDAAILDSKGWVLYKLGNYLESEKYLMRALKLNDDPEIVSHVIKLLVKVDKIKDAKNVYKKYIKLKPKDKILIELKKILDEI